MRLVEDGSEHSGTLVSELVASKTASEGWGGDGERLQGVSMGIDAKENTRQQIRAPGGLLERLQRGVALEALG